MNDVQAVLEQLRSNKKKPANHAGATRRVAKKRKPRQKKFWTKKLGQQVGYCPNCQIMVGKAECATHEHPASCHRCGENLINVGHDIDYRKLMDWRRHDKWGNCRVPSNQTRAQHFMGANIIQKLKVDNHNRRPIA